MLNGSKNFYDSWVSTLCFFSTYTYTLYPNCRQTSGSTFRSFLYEEGAKIILKNDDERSTIEPYSSENATPKTKILGSVTDTPYFLTAT